MLSKKEKTLVKSSKKEIILLHFSFSFKSVVRILFKIVHFTVSAVGTNVDNNPMGKQRASKHGFNGPGSYPPRALGYTSEW